MGVRSERQTTDDRFKRTPRWAVRFGPRKAAYAASTRPTTRHRHSISATTLRSRVQKREVLLPFLSPPISKCLQRCSETGAGRWVRAWRLNIGEVVRERWILMCVSATLISP